MPKVRKTIIIALFLVLVLPSYLEAFEYFKQVDKYDAYFLKYSQMYFGADFDWRFFKAQAIAESRLQPDAQSEQGALGIMQILPTTFKYVVWRNDEIKGDIRDPRWNIAAGIYYDRILWDLWQADRPFLDRINFMFASYNAGENIILQAQQIALGKGLNPLLWKSIKQTLPLVEGDGSGEIISYVKEIHLIKKTLR